MVNARPASAAAAAVSLLVLIGVGAAQTTVSSRPEETARSVHGLLEPERCYRFVFSIPGAPTYKVLQLGPGDWIKAEVVAGPASVEREPLWINTAQIITIRNARCAP